MDGIGMPGSRVAAIRRFAAAVAEHRLHLERRAPLEELVDEITKVPGLGPWTAHYLAMRLGEPDAFPASDLGLRRALGSRGGEPASASEVEQGAAAWRPFRAWAALHLWAGPGAGAA